MAEASVVEEKHLATLVAVAAEELARVGIGDAVCSGFARLSVSSYHPYFESMLQSKVIGCAILGIFSIKV